LISIVNADCTEIELPVVDTIFSDPPDNLNLAYSGFVDKIDDYGAFCEKFIAAGLQASIRGMWISFNSRHMLTMAAAAHASMQPGDVLTPCVQTITFGNQRTKPGLLTNNFRPLWYISHGQPNFEEVREPSWRQLNGDKRADPRGKLVGDVFDFPRVTGNSKQRRAWHPTQLNEDLVERCLLLTTAPDSTVMDIFAGTGTSGRVCRKLGLRCILVEKSEVYYGKLVEELGSNCASSARQATFDFA
jgi:DNA modification methylase